MCNMPGRLMLSVHRVRPVMSRASSLRNRALPISGSDLRLRAREGRSLVYRMPVSVAAYIREHGLYRAAS